MDVIDENRTFTAWLYGWGHDGCFELSNLRDEEFVMYLEASHQELKLLLLSSTLPALPAADCPPVDLLTQTTPKKAHK